MKSEVKLNFDVKIYPYNDDPLECIKFSLECEKPSKETVKFEIYDGSDREPMYFGFIDNGGWFLDPENKVGTFICDPYSIEEMVEEFEEIEEYDEDDCYIIAKSIDLIRQSSNNLFMPEPFNDYLPF